MIGIGLTAPAASANIDTDHVERATVWVDAVWKGEVEVSFADDTTETFPAEAKTYCTGFVVSETGHIATAGHCVLYDESVRKKLLIDVIQSEKLAPTGGQFSAEDINQLKWPVRVEDTPTIYIAQPSIIKDALFDNDGMIAQLIDAQDPEAGDNALLQVSGKDTSKAVLNVAMQAPKIRDDVTAVGFPGDTASQSVADRQSPTFKEGTISAQVVSKKGVPQLQLDGELIGGMSGGPTLNAAGEVVGINSSSFTNRNQSYISDTATFRTFLEKNGVKLTGAPNTQAASEPQPAAVQPTQQNNDNTPWPLYIIGGLVIAGLVGFIIYLLKRKPAPVAASPTPTPPPGDTNQV